MRFQVLVAVHITAQNQQDADRQALKLQEMMKQPMLKMVVEGDGVRLYGDGQPIAFQPQPA